MLAYGARRRHGRADAAQPVDEAALLVYAAERLDGQDAARAVQQPPQLHGGRDVSAEDDDATRLNIFEQGARLFVEFRARQPYVKELSDLLFEGERS